jgi:hypothetical protein
MFTIKSLVNHYASFADNAPGGRDRLHRSVGRLERTPLEEEKFQRDLQSFRRTNIGCIVALVLIFIALIVSTGFLIHANIGNGAVVASTFAGFGTLTGALTTFILALFRVKGQADMLRLLSQNLDPATVQTILNILAK